MFLSAEVQVLEVATSDHLPLYLHLNKRIYVHKQQRFHFENMWLREQDCRNVVCNGWEIGIGLDIIEKIRMCTIKLQEWGGGLSNEYKIKIQNCRMKMKKLRSRRHVQGIRGYNAARWEYLKLLD